MSDEATTDASPPIADVLATIDDELEELATAGGITADTRGDLAVETLLRIVRLRSMQSAIL